MNTMSTATKAEREPLLTRADRCEATCPAAAMVRVSTKDLGVFHFCGHHADLNIPVIPDVVSIYDERQPITVKTTNTITEGEPT